MNGNGDVLDGDSFGLVHSFFSTVYRNQLILIWLILVIVWMVVVIVLFLLIINRPDSVWFKIFSGVLLVDIIITCIVILIICIKVHNQFTFVMKSLKLITNGGYIKPILQFIDYLAKMTTTVKDTLIEIENFRFLPLSLTKLISGDDETLGLLSATLWSAIALTKSPNWSEMEKNFLYISKYNYYDWVKNFGEKYKTQIEGKIYNGPHFFEQNIFDTIGYMVESDFLGQRSAKVVFSVLTSEKILDEITNIFNIYLPSIVFLCLLSINMFIIYQLAIRYEHNTKRTENGEKKKRRRTLIVTLCCSLVATLVCALISVLFLLVYCGLDYMSNEILRLKDKETFSKRIKEFDSMVENKITSIIKSLSKNQDLKNPSYSMKIKISQFDDKIITKFINGIIILLTQTELDDIKFYSVYLSAGGFDDYDSGKERGGANLDTPLMIKTLFAPFLGFFSKEKNIEIASKYCAYKWPYVIYLINNIDINGLNIFEIRPELRKVSIDLSHQFENFSDQIMTLSDKYLK